MSITGAAFESPALQTDIAGNKPFPWQAGAALFCLMLMIYLIFFGGHWVMADQNYRLAWAESILDHGSNDISSPQLSAKYGIHAKYSKYGVGQSLLHIPFILMARGIYGLTGIHCEGPLSMIVYVFNGALGIVLVYLILRNSGSASRSAFCRALIIGIASVWFPYTKVEYGEALVATLVMAIWLCGPHLPIIAGLLAGAAVTIRMDALLWAVPTILLTMASRRNKLKALAAMLPGILLTCWTNYARTGSITNSGYEHGFTNNPIFGLYGELFSFGKSIFIFSPLLVLYPFVIGSMYKDERTRRLALWSVVLLAGQLLLYARWWDWSGDDAWGPRFLVVSTMCGLILIAASPMAGKKIWWALAAVGLAMQLPPVLLGPHATMILDHSRLPQKHDAWPDSTSVITVDDVRFRPSYSQVTSTLELLRLKIFGMVNNTEDSSYESSTWLGSFQPPLTPADATWDIFWLHLHDKHKTEH